MSAPPRTPVRAHVPTARSVAATTLLRVLGDGAFAAAALDAELGRAAQLDGRDRALATELTYGTLRLLCWLEQRIDRHTSKPVRSGDERARVELLLGAYQLFFTRIPPFAAVNEAVASVRRERGVKLAGFANAVLRKVSRDAAGAAVDAKVAAASTAPRWLVRALDRALGDGQAVRFLEASSEASVPCLRVDDPAERERWIARIGAELPDARVEAGLLSSHAVYIQGGGRLDDVPGYGTGALGSQEEGSQVVALSLGAEAGDGVLDACAGRGQKSCILVRAVSPNGFVDAADLHASKLEALHAELLRQHLAVRAAHVVDWSVGRGDVVGGYDRVLVDAPCTGTGTLRRRPEILLRRTEASLTELTALQRAVLARASECVRPGGVLVYAVCSVLREEAEEVVSTLVDRGDFALAPFEAATPKKLAGDAPQLRLLPHVHGTDGYFLASLRRRT